MPDVREPGFVHEQAQLDRNAAPVGQVEVGRGIEPVGIAAEAQRRWLETLALDVEDMVHHDAVQSAAPGPRPTASP